MHAMWVTHGMVHAFHVGDTWHGACVPCGFFRSIQTGSVEENKGKKKNEKKKREKQKGGRKI